MLEKWQKITDIVLKGFAAIAIAIGTYWLGQQRLDMDKSTVCANFVQQSFDMVQKETFSDARQSMLDFRIERHNAICGTLEPKYIQALNNAWLPPSTTHEAQGSPGPTPTASTPDAAAPVASTRLEVEANLPVPQWVAISKKNDDSYSALNFDTVSGAVPPQTVGNVLRARWFVNIRARNTPVVRGDNPVIGQLLGGQCVRVEQSVSGTLNEWAKVVRVPCPANS